MQRPYEMGERYVFNLILLSLSASINLFMKH
jgi:hypothetical protein